MKLQVPITWLVFALCITGPSWAEWPRTATTKTGEVVGQTIGDDLVAFRGIPFSSPPVGKLRWRAPQPAASWKGVRDATSFGPACIQQRAPETGRANESEECLFLNVWAPKTRSAAGLPVMVWIHGGGLNNGSTRGPQTDGAALARQGVVLVSIQYRLNVLGFLASSALTKEAGESGNYGLMDQIAALEWVRDNIAAFGGDPSRVTVFGESAGGASVHALLAMPRARGLFRAAIAESPWVTYWLYTPASGDNGSEVAGDRFLAKFDGGLPGRVRQARRP